MSTINDSDLLLVERNGNLHQITYDQMSTLNDDDILLVERGGVQYKVEAQYVSTGPNGVILPSVEVLTPLNGAGLNDGQSYTPMSSAYVSTDSTPIYHRYFPELITTVSGGTWFNENKIFDGLNYTYAELQGATGVVSQAVFTAPSTWVDGETTVSAANATGGAGGTIEVLDASDTVLRTYTLPGTLVETAIGIVRIGNKIRFTASGQNIGLQICTINRAPTDYVITGRVTLEFADDTDLDKMVAPIIQTDENGNVKIPTTSTVDSTTTILGVNKSMQHRFYGSGYNRTYDAHDDPSGAQIVPVGPRMTWAKVETSGYSGIIADNVSGFGAYFETSGTGGRHDGGPYLRDNESEYNLNYRWNRQGYYSNITEIGVAPKVLDIVTYSGDAQTINQIPHNLGCKPGMIIIKHYGSSFWVVWHKDLSPGNFLYLNTPNGQSTSYNYFPSEPTKDHFYVGGNNFEVNAPGGGYVAYVFAADTPGKIKCGTYTGTGSSQLVDLGLQPGFVLTKDKYNYDSWACANTQCSDNGIFWEPNSDSGMQGASQNFINMNHAINKMRLQGNDARLNGGGREYVYLAISATLTGPQSTQLNLLGGQDLEYFTDGTQITSNLAASGSNQSFETESYVGNGSSINITPGTSTNRWWDSSLSTANKWMVWIKGRTVAYNHIIFDSERSPKMGLSSNRSVPEQSEPQAYLGDYNNIGYTLGNGSKVNANNAGFLAWQFQAAQQFFDVQKYVGNNGTSTIQHDLGVEPGCIIIKSISSNDSWWVYHSEVGGNLLLKLNSYGGPFSANGWMSVTDADFTLTGSSGAINEINRDYVSYIFAKDTPYVKCGSYTASGNDNFQVDVGFKPRWVLIKSTGSNYSWVILDKKLPDQRIRPDVNDAADFLQWSFTDTGFTLRDVTNSASVNAGGASYVYIAIADETEGHPPFPPSSTTVQGTPDVNAATMVVNAESFDVGDSASAPALEASITSVAGSDGNKLLVDGTTGTWLPGLYAKGSETTIDAPGPDEITFTSQNQGTPAFSGIDATLSSRTWTLESGTTATGPWTVVDSYVDYDVLNSQTGATPWTSNKPNLTPNTFYRVKVQYNSTNAESVESVYNTFKTGDA